MQTTFQSDHGRLRHSRWYERILLSFRTNLVLGFLLTTILPALWEWGWHWHNRSAMITMVASGIAYLIAISAVHAISRFPGTRALVYILPFMTVAYLVMGVLLQACQLAFSAETMVISYVISLCAAGAGYLVAARYRIRKIAVVPMGQVGDFCQQHAVDWRWLQQPDLKDMRVDGVVADLKSEMSPEWQRFLADCMIRRIPVHDAQRFHEELTGKVGLEHVYQNRYGLLVTNGNYEIAKRAVDFIVALSMLPLILPVIGMAAVLIRRDDPGPVFFRQQRAGFQGREFDVYKLRSMYVDPGNQTPTADGEDPRITRIGRKLRKYRIDELPQLFNVLKGDMSLIGPRPETPSLTEAYERDIPFFRYRHVVRPGITGWAQIEQGYVSEVEGSKRKLEYDFYYIKNFSFRIDILILVRTIRTVFTGSGAR
ncbi:exopolysaccharide biosynthesis polyprenyl glycosylphosphotransferase [Kushneria sinocarnis]|uniref:Exopolysaccharide biosynthesis polyprenyl glycosylphosphotransferase n=1 Tax=Kushneria sinocarnis TaxID=595502 RepID=A0A420X0Z0_9GAMM|nr:sugar transferase [Kushneria sinocarnis]RKR07526.1 exopolysaccharide biosynthesis polyprenyl glycosylphosphotransferase [Kushneria sinocarnis]